MKRILLKLSGEALSGSQGKGFDYSIVKDIARQIKMLSENTEIGIVIGGGNFWRGRTGNEIERTKSDQIGMLATIMNSIYVSSAFQELGLKTHVFTPFPCDSMTEVFSKDRAEECFKEGKIVFFAAGTGHPYFSTDTGVVLRALEVNADEILLAKAIDGVYDDDPKDNPNARRFDEISLDNVIKNNLKVIDLTASILARDNKMPMLVFKLNEENSIINTVNGQFNGTRITV